MSIVFSIFIDCQLFKREFVLHCLEIVFGKVDTAVLIPSFIEGEKVNMGVRNVTADDFPDSAGTEDLFHVLADFFDGLHKGFVICVF